MWINTVTCSLTTTHRPRIMFRDFPVTKVNLAKARRPFFPNKNTMWIYFSSFPPTSSSITHLIWTASEHSRREKYCAMKYQNERAQDRASQGKEKTSPENYRHIVPVLSEDYDLSSRRRDDFVVSSSQSSLRQVLNSRGSIVNATKYVEANWFEMHYSWVFFLLSSGRLFKSLFLLSIT